MRILCERGMLVHLAVGFSSCTHKILCFNFIVCVTVSVSFDSRESCSSIDRTLKIEYIMALKTTFLACFQFVSTFGTVEHSFIQYLIVLQLPFDTTQLHRIKNHLSDDRSKAERLAQTASRKLSMCPTSTFLSIRTWGARSNGHHGNHVMACGCELVRRLAGRITRSFYQVYNTTIFSVGLTFVDRTMSTMRTSTQELCLFIGGGVQELFFCVGHLFSRWCSHHPLTKILWRYEWHLLQHPS